jgi:N-formylmaleamate deformylase
MDQSIQSADLSCRGTRIRYHRREGTGRTLLLVHGISDDGLCWSPFLRELDPALDIVMPDLRGHGGSEDPDEGWNLRTMADEIASLAGGLGLGSPFMAGCSLGASIVLTLAACHPGLPRRIFLEDPVPFWNAPETLPEDTGKGLEAWLKGIKRKTARDLEAELLSASPSWDTAEHGPWINAKHRMSSRAIRVATARDFAPPHYGAMLKAVACPVFLVTAEPDRGALCSDEDLAVLKSLVPQMQSARFGNAGHSVRRESPGPYRKAFVDFISRERSPSPPDQH